MGKPKYLEGASLKDKLSFKRFLAEDEELVLATGYGKNFLRHRFAYFFLWPGILFLLVPLGLAYFMKLNVAKVLMLGLVLETLFAYFKTIWMFHAHRYLLTTRRVMIKEGFFSVKITSALYDKVTHIEVDQSFYDRIIMRHGSIIINTAGANKDEIRIECVDAPIDFKNLLERLINREREQYGRQTGPIVAVEGELVE